MDNTSCKHCGTPVTDKFCPSCGQRYFTTPYSKEIILYLFTQTVDFGATYFKTLWTLFIKPNKVVSTFLSGNVKKYVNPLKYLVLTVALLILWDMLVVYITDDPDKVNENAELVWYLALFVIILFLILANKLFWQQFKWVEHLIIGIYFAVQMTVIVVIIYTGERLTLLWGLIESETVDTAYHFNILFIYYLYYNLTIFKNRKFLTFIKSLYILLIVFVIVGLFFTFFK